MKITACLLSVLIGTASASRLRRDTPTETITADSPPVPPPSGVTTVHVDPTDYPTYTSQNTDPYNTNVPVPCGEQEQAIRQLQVLNNYIYPKEAHSTEKMLDILTQVSKTEYCSQYTYGYSMNTEALVHFSEQACAAAFPEDNHAYWLSNNAYYSSSVCGPLRRDQWNGTSSLCISFSFSPRYIVDSPSVWLLTTQGLCKAAYYKALTFCSQVAIEDEYLSSATELSLEVNYSFSIFDWYPPTTPPGPPVPLPEPIPIDKRFVDDIVNEVLRKRGMQGLDGMKAKRGLEGPNIKRGPRGG